MKKLGPKAKAVIGPMARLLPKPMKPVKAWALVDKTTGDIAYLNLGYNRAKAIKASKSNERIARVEITEVKRAH